MYKTYIVSTKNYKQKTLKFQVTAAREPQTMAVNSTARASLGSTATLKQSVIGLPTRSAYRWAGTYTVKPLLVVTAGVLNYITWWFAAVWPDFAKFCHFLQNVRSLWHYLRVSLIVGIVMNLLWLNMEDNEQLYIVENRKILKNNLAILSHWFAPETDPTKRKKWSRNLHILCFKHFDWLLKNFQPIRMLKTSVA